MANQLSSDKLKQEHLQEKNVTRVWMVRGESGRLYDAFREYQMTAIGWPQLAAHVRPSMDRKQLIALYQSAEPQTKLRMIVSGASQVWRFVNEMKLDDWVVTYSPANRLYSIGRITGAAE